MTLPRAKLVYPTVTDSFARGPGC